jgi:resolvase
MTKIGYARVSHTDQKLDRQKLQLKEAGVKKIYSEKISGTITDRPELQALLNFIREGDIVVVSELERLGRNNQQLTEVMTTIQREGATLEVLNLPSLKGIEDENLRRLLNNLILELYKYQAEAEREKIRERQAQGIAIAKANGRFKGRKPKFTEDSSQLQHAFQLFLDGASDQKVEELTGINYRTFRRYREKYNIKRN